MQLPWPSGRRSGAALQAGKGVGWSPAQAARVCLPGALHHLQLLYFQHLEKEVPET